MKVRRLNIPRKASSLFLPILTDEEYSKYNDINRMKMLIDELVDRVIVTNKATRKNVTTGELKHLVEGWADTKGYKGNNYILEPYLIKRLYEKKIPLKPYSTGTIYNDEGYKTDFSRCFVAVSEKSILKISCYINGKTPDDDFKVKPFDWEQHYICLNDRHYERLRELGYGKLYYGSEYNWKDEFEKRKRSHEHG